MQRINLDAEASQYVLVKVMDSEADTLPTAAIAQAGGAFDWLADEPDLYTDADLVKPQAGWAPTFRSTVLARPLSTTTLGLSLHPTPGMRPRPG